MEKENKKTIEIPFGEKDSELYKFEYTIPEGSRARIEGNKVIIEKLENEDERIRKSLVEFFRKFNQKNMWDEVFSFGDVLSYLERQKEQKPIPTEDEKDFLEKEVKAFLCNYDNEFDDDAPTYDIAEHFYQLGKNSQKPAEWSEEDAHNLSKFIEKRAKAYDFNLPNRGYDIFGFAKDILKYLRINHEKVEWSDEDKEPMEIRFAGKVYKVHGIRVFPGGKNGYIIEDEPGHYDCITNPDEVLGYGINGCGSPYPTKETNFGQLHWKPSEEQMKAILDAMIHATGNTLIYLNSLYEQLKAL